MDFTEEAIIEISKRGGCSLETATFFYNRTNKNIERSVRLARLQKLNSKPMKITFSKEMPHIIKYKNGLMVNQIFYSYLEKSNKELKEMLERNEFDKDLLNISDEEVDCLIEEREDEYATDKSCLFPLSNFIIDNCKNSISFKVKISNNLYSVLIKRGKLIHELLYNITQKIGKRVICKKYKENEQVDLLINSVVELEFN